MSNKESVRHTKPLIGVVIWTILSSSAFADDWPQWQGPDRNAISKEGGLLKEWPKDGPPLAWKITGLGGGDSAPSIAASRDGRQDTLDDAPRAGFQAASVAGKRGTGMHADG